MSLTNILAAIAARHQAHWQADAWYRRAWYIWPQAASVLVLALLLNPFDAGRAPAAPWSGPNPGTQPAKPSQPAAPQQPTAKSPATAPPGKPAVTAASEQDQQTCRGMDIDASLSACTRLIESLPRTDPWLADAYYFRGRDRDKKQQPDLALKDFTEALSANPNGSGSLLYRGVVYANMGKRDLAIADYSAASRINPSWSLPIANLADTYRLNGDLNVALSKIGEAFRLEPTNPWILTVKTRIAFDRKKWSDAVADATSWIAVAPTASEAFYLRGAAKEELKDPTGSLADLTEAERLGYKSSGLFNYKGSAREQLGNVDQAQIEYAASLQIDPRNLYALNRRGQIAFSKRLWSDVEANTSAVLAIDPKNYTSLVLRVRMASDRGDFSSAVAEADRILADRPNDVYVIYLRARSFLNGEIAIIEPCKTYGHVTADRSRWSIGGGTDLKCRTGPDIAGGIRELDRALALNQISSGLAKDSLVDIYASRGNGYLWLGNRQLAERDLRAGLAIDPTSTFIRQLMQRAGLKF